MSLKAVRAAVALGLGLAAAAAGVAPATAAETGPVRLAVAVPLIAPAGATGLITADALERYTAPLGLLNRELDAVIDRPVAIGIDPMIIVSIRVLGASAPPTALAWLERLETATNETFALSYADSDITLATQAGLPGVPQPESFDFAMDPAQFAAQQPEAPSPSPTEPVDPVLPPYPSTEDLLDWPYTLSGVAWPRDDTAVASDLAAIAASGFTTTILSSDNLAAEPGAGVTAAVDGQRILVSDAAISTALRAATDAREIEEQQETTAALVQSVTAAGAAQDGEQATVFATLARGIPAISSRLPDVLAALENDPAIALVPVSQAVGESPSPATVVDKPQAADRVAEVIRMNDSEVADRRYATIALDPVAITADRRLRLLALLATIWEPNPIGWQSAVRDYLAASLDLRGSVRLVESSTFLLIADNNQYLPITVSNALDQPVTVYVTVRPETTLLSIGSNRVELEVEPGAQGKVNVPVQSLANGIVMVDVSLTSVLGTPIGAHSFAEVNVQAGWETPIVVAVAALVVVVFGVGIVRNILRRRKLADE